MIQGANFASVRGWWPLRLCLAAVALTAAFSVWSSLGALEPLRDEEIKLESLVAADGPTQSELTFGQQNFLIARLESLRGLIDRGTDEFTVSSAHKNAWAWLGGPGILQPSFSLPTSADDHIPRASERGNS